MPKIGIFLDTEAFQRLADLSDAERRPLSWEAEVLIRRAIGLPDGEPLPQRNDGGMQHDRETTAALQ